MFDFSIVDPAAYWRAVINFLGIIWRKDYEIYCDVSRGKEFPSWFVGGEINWVDTVLARGNDPSQAGKLAVVAEREDGGRTKVTYAELRSLVERVATGLWVHGVKRGDRIGLLMENGVEATASMLALSYMGAIAVPLFSGFNADPIVARLGACEASGLIATSGFLRRGNFVKTLPVISKVRAQLPHLELLVLKRSPNDPDPADGDRTSVSWSDLESSNADTLRSETMSPDDPFMVIFTSGTTGKPKGTVHIHGGFPLKIAHDAAVHFNLKSGDVFCWPADMGWIAGPLVLASALIRGATLICYDGASDFPDWSRMARLIEDHRITHYGSAPTLVRGFAANPDLSTSADLSSVELLLTAGEAISFDHFSWFQRNFGRGEAPLINYTGGTEVSGAILSSVLVKPIVRARFNTRSPGVAAEVVDASCAPVVGQIGELAIREPFVGMTKAFWQDEKRYLETYWQAVPGMWIHGDLAMEDADGNFLLLGRSDDTMKIAGKRVGPAEIEEVLVEIPGVEEAAVIGAEDAVKGQAIVAFLTAPTRVFTPEFHAMVSKRVQDRLGRPFAVREVFIVQQLPKTRSSKIMRRVIRDVYAKTPLGDMSSVVNPESIDQIRRVLETT
jgi:acetyl-CoA synthetase